MSLQVKPVTFVTDQCLLKQRSGKTGVCFSLTRVKMRTVPQSSNLYKPLNFLSAQKTDSNEPSYFIRWAFQGRYESFKGQKRPIIEITQMTNYLTWVNVIIEINESMNFSFRPNNDWIWIFAMARSNFRNIRDERSMEWSFEWFDEFNFA